MAFTALSTVLVQGIHGLKAVHTRHFEVSDKYVEAAFLLEEIHGIFSPTTRPYVKLLLLQNSGNTIQNDLLVIEHQNLAFRLFHLAILLIV
jgi:hypothetical protein